MCCVSFLNSGQQLSLVSHLAAAPWFAFNRREGVDIQDAYKLLSPTLGARGASIIFALALLASGQNSTITGTLAGQVVMEGFLQVRACGGL
jgi:manganese transport protein